MEPPRRRLFFFVVGHICDFAVGSEQFFRVKSKRTFKVFTVFYSSADSSQVFGNGGIN